MAYIRKPEDEIAHEEQQLTSDTGQVLTPGGESQTGGVVQPSRPKQTGGGQRFADIRRFLGANVPQAEQLAGRVGGFIEQKGSEELSQAQQSALQGFGEQVKQAAPTQERFTQAHQMFEKPVESVAQGGAKEVQALRTAQYRGPTALSEEAKAGIAGAVQRAKERAQLAGSEAGTMQLVGNVVPQGDRYTQGMKALDVMLLRRQPGAQKALQDVATRVMERAGQVEHETGITAQQQAEAARQQLAARQQALEAMISGSLRKGTEPLAQAEQALEARTIKGYSDAEQFLKTGDTKFLTEEARNILQIQSGVAQQPGAPGLPGNEQEILARIARAKQLGVDVGATNYLQRPSEQQIREQIQLGAAGNEQDRARLQALRTLAGMDPTLAQRYEQRGALDIGGLGGALEKGITHQETYNQYMDEYNKGQLVRQNVIPPSTERKIEPPKDVFKLNDDDFGIVRGRVMNQLARAYDTDPKWIRIPPALDKAIRYGIVNEKNFLGSTAENTVSLEDWADGYKAREIDRKVAQYEAALKQEQDEAARQKANAEIIRRNAEIEEKLKFLGMPSQKTDLETKPKTLVLGQMLGNQVQNIVKGIG